MKKELILLLSIGLYLLPLRGQNILSSSVRQRLSSSKEDESKVNLLDSLGGVFDWSYADSSFLYANQALLLAEKLNYAEGKAWSMTLIAEQFVGVGSYNDAEVWAYKALQIFKSFNNLMGVINVYLIRGMATQDEGKYDEALLQFHEMLRLAKTLRKSTLTWEGWAEGMLASVHERAGNEDSALFYSYQIADSVRLNWSGALTVLGNIYAKKGQDSLAVAIYRKAVQVALRGFGMVDIIDAYSGIGRVYFREGKTDSAIWYAAKAMDLPCGRQYPIRLLKPAQLLTDIYETRHQTDSTLKYLRNTIALKDSLFSQQKTRQAQNFEFNEQITDLNQKSQLAESNLSRANLLKNVTIGGVILALIIAGLLYRQNILKEKNNNLITQKNSQLQHLVTEKEWLLKELQHRVKNNLQVMMSLQQLQARNLTTEEAQKAVTDSGNRLYAMALIHQKLYQADGPDKIDMRQYIGELTRYLAEAFAPTKAVRVETDLAADIELEVTQAIPVGLILNEAITNTFKYAFINRAPGSPAPHLQINLFRTWNGEEIELLIADNGRGYDATRDKTSGKSMGFSLMEALAMELDGVLSVTNENGVTLILRFTPSQVPALTASSSLRRTFAYEAGYQQANQS
jgi:two-component sensor histidine kinase